MSHEQTTLYTSKAVKEDRPGTLIHNCFILLLFYEWKLHGVREKLAVEKFTFEDSRYTTKNIRKIFPNILHILKNTRLSQTY